MKITINVECTPEEARAFLGLPDLKPLQASMMAEFEERLRTGLNEMDPQALAKNWFGGANMKAFEEMQKAFWAQMMGKAGKGE
ncbi:DUF6489 family protein [Gallaecimonas pentaromativorans]|uniref:Ribosomal protein S1 n=1 Tax=Gallaecimonas pentaromativorans TaxID=584787 RepID=A0A3N1PZI4_9GAMM|nr:DUF6489 family protein [Gallaecimonas pentaromativorans]MED5524225.1 DUF6489 family protein [Pseudomonadota bacterium]ROQ29986.1 hypothetical protein EDC28_102365 [Gallaecimonas pentaromativorans]